MSIPGVAFALGPGNFALGVEVPHAIACFFE
jgi:hypothetical protein